ncbi:MAG TPA: SH3 domain-containing protein [Candidatus Limnocylindria bacterium]|nr:SH3 domain-containing protein [Candidatus Limnocylindria bacterium]
MTLASVIAVAGPERPGCFDDEILTLRGWIWEDQGVYDCHHLGSAPSWLACGVEHVRLTTLAYPPGDPTAAMIDPADGPLRVAVDPATAAADALRPNRWVELRGRFNDPATSACDELGAGLLEECLATFVVSEARALEFAHVLPPNAWATVAVDELRVRADLRLSSPVIDGLARGDRIFIDAGPFAVDGMAWYSVAYGSDYATAQINGWPHYGYVAAGEADVPFLQPAPITCVDVATTLEALVSLTPQERVACIGSRELSLEGNLSPGEYAEDGTCMVMGEVPPWEPRWLAFGCSGLQGGPVSLPLVQLPLHVDPIHADTIKAAGTGPVRVRGHFDDPAATGCEDRSRPPVLWGVFYPPVDDAAIVLRCRQAFVVTGIERIES